MEIKDNAVVYQKVFMDEIIIKTCSDYLYGDCHLFALALHDYFKDNSRIVLVWQHEDDNLDDFGFLAHAFVVIDEDYWVDCRGVIDEDLVKNEYIENEDLIFLIEENADIVLDDYIKNLYLEDFFEDEIKQIQRFINNNAHCYLI